MDEPVDQRSDIWAFGVVLYEMLTGQSCFGRETVSDTVAAVLTKDPDLDGCAGTRRGVSYSLSREGSETTALATSATRSFSSVEAT